MRIYAKKEQWKRVSKNLNLIKLPSKRNKIGEKMKHFSIQLNAPNFYPRVHIITRMVHGYKDVQIDVHVDNTPHSDVIYSHTKIDSIINAFKNS